MLKRYIIGLIVNVHKSNQTNYLFSTVFRVR